MMNQEEAAAEESPIGGVFQNKQTTSSKSQEEERDMKPVCLVEEAQEDRDSDTFIMLNEAGINSALNGVPEGAQGGPAEHIKQDDASDNQPVKRKRNKRSLIWRHYEQLDGSASARCCICMKSLPFKGCGTGNLYRHMSKRHPEVFSQLAADRQHPPPPHSSQSSDVNDDTLMLQENIGVTENQSLFSGLLKASDRKERCLFTRMQKLTEALRRMQPEETWDLEHQRELLEKLRAVNAVEAAAERGQIELLRTAQLEEAKDLSRQREEVQKEKTTLLKKWEELREERERLFYKDVGTNSNTC